MRFSIRKVKKGIIENQEKETGKKVNRKEIEEKIKEVLNSKREEITYAENMVVDGKDHSYLKPSEALTKKAYNFLIRKYLEIMSSDKMGHFREFGYSYTKIVKGAVIRYQFNYYIDKKNKKKIGTKGNQFNLLIAYDYKNSRGIWNERLKFINIAGYVYKPTYHSFIYPYHYDKKRNEGGMRYGYHEYSKNYRELKINPYFTLKAGERDEYETQRIMELNPTHVEMLYKLGYRNLWKQRVSEKKVEFLKKHAKEIEKELGKLITVEELSKAYTLKEKGIGLKKIHEVLYFIRVFSVFLDEYNFDGKAKQVINGNQKGTKTKDVTKIMRMVNVAKEHGIEHVKTCRGVCYYFDMDFEAFIFKGLKERESVIEEWKEKKREFRLKNQREYRRRLREQKEKEKMRRISFDDFCQKNKVVFEDLGKENFYIKEINGIQIEEALWVNEISIAEFYEEKKELYEFEKNNKIIVEKKEKEFILVSVNDKIINKTIYSDKTKAIKRTYEDFLYEEKVKKTTLEEATEKLKEIKVDRFIFTPLKTMKDLQEIQDEMQLCLIRNEYHKRIKGRKVVLYIAREENQDKTKGEVIEFKIEKNEITPVQIRGKENKNTENYEAIKEIAKTLKYEALQIQQ